MIKPGGHLIVEMLIASPDDSDRLIIEGQNCIIKLNRPGGNLYLPSKEELLEYSSKFFDNIVTKNYKVNGNIKRTIYIFTRSF